MAASKLSKLASELRDADDEITENHIHFDNLPPGTKVDTDATGRLKAISIPDDEVTPTDPPRKPISEPPKSQHNKLKFFDPARIDTAPKAFAFLVLVVAVVVLAIFGPEWVRGVVAP